MAQRTPQSHGATPCVHTDHTLAPLGHGTYALMRGYCETVRIVGLDEKQEAQVGRRVARTAAWTTGARRTATKHTACPAHAGQEAAP